MTFDFPQVFELISDRSVWQNGKHPAFSICHEDTYHEKFIQSSRMSYILICVRVALAASDVQSILDISAADEIRMEYRNHGLA